MVVVVRLLVVIKETQNKVYFVMNLLLLCTMNNVIFLQFSQCQAHSQDTKLC